MQQFTLFKTKNFGGVKQVMSINNRIKQVRNSLELTQIKFAERITLSNGYYARLELGTQQINERVIRLIINEFNINEHWLKTGEGEMFIDESDALLSQMMSLFKSLNPSVQKCAYKIVTTLADCEWS